MTILMRRPLGLLGDLQSDMNRLFDERLRQRQSDLAGVAGDWVPSVDIHEDDTAYHVSVDLPGMKPEEIEVTAHDGRLTIKGERTTTNEDKELKRSERTYGSFLREFSMPDDANLDAIEAKTDHGVLDIVVPKVAPTEAKRITVS